MSPPPPACVTNVIIWRLPTFSCGEVSWRKWGIYYQGDCVCRDSRLCRHRPGCVNLSFVSSQHGHSIVLVRCITSETKHDPWSIPYHPKALFLDTSYTSTQQLDSELLMSVTKSKSWWGWGQRSVCWTNLRPRRTRLGHDKWQHWSCASSSGSGGAGAGVRTRPPRHHRPVCTGPRSLQSAGAGTGPGSSPLRDNWQCQEVWWPWWHEWAGAAEISRQRCKHVTDGHHEELTTNLLGLSFEWSCLDDR